MNKYLEKVKKEINLIKSLLRSRSASSGMTYVELIVVLGIFSILSSVAIFNYGDFQNKVDITNLASDIASKVVEAQKSSLDGVLPLTGTPYDTWKPAYGVYFDTTTSASQKQFIYFVDLNQDSIYGAGSELLDTINITKNNFISKIEKCTDIACTSPTIITPITITFSRPSSSPVFTGASVSGSEYVRITVSSPKTTTLIKLYPSGRVQIN